MGTGGVIAARILDPAERPDRSELRALDRPRTIWLDERWWRYVEQTDLHEVRYLAIEDGGRLVALAPLLISRAGNGLLFYDLPKMAGDESAFGDADRLTLSEQERYSALRADLRYARMDQYPSVTMAVFGSHSGIALADDLGPFGRSRVLAALPDLLRAAAEELGCRSSGLLYLSAQELESMRGVGAAGYHAAVVGAEGVLELPAVDSFEAYLAHMRSSRRRSVRKELADFTARGLRCVVRTGKTALSQELVDLQVALRAKHGLPGGRERVLRDFHLLASLLGSDCVVISAHRAESIVGFALYLRSGDSLYARTGGFEREADGTSCYFPLAYHETARWALANGIRHIFYGLSASEAKRARGCRLEPRFGLFQFTGAEATRLFETLALQQRGERMRLMQLGVALPDISHQPLEYAA
jgi:uncharacterized protein